MSEWKPFVIGKIKHRTTDNTMLLKLSYEEVMRLQAALGVDQAVAAPRHGTQVDMELSDAPKEQPHLPAARFMAVPTAIESDLVPQVPPVVEVAMRIVEIGGRGDLAMATESRAARLFRAAAACLQRYVEGAEMRGDMRVHESKAFMLVSENGAVHQPPPGA